MITGRKPQPRVQLWWRQESVCDDPDALRKQNAALASALAEGGCRILKLGIESGSHRVRKEVLKRFMSDEDILSTVTTADFANAEITTPATETIDSVTQSLR